MLSCSAAVIAFFYSHVHIDAGGSGFMTDPCAASLSRRALRAHEQNPSCDDPMTAFFLSFLFFGFATFPLDVFLLR